ncbi:uncharacterized protein VTP21DRAFT_8945 [Calcarisporiella thermophila]|uniref:uncharacterized protein n=1 Tax=Calcarisporiella thermophila TaxID=911321 RepID=UPI0037432A77
MPNDLKNYDAYQLILKTKKKIEDDDQAVELDPEETMASVLQQFDNDSRVLVSVPVVNLSYVSLVHNYMIINGLILSLDKKNKSAHLVLILFTIAKYRSNLESKLIANWEKWTATLISKKYTIKTIFLWITGGIQSTKEPAEKREEEASQNIYWMHPKYIVCEVLEDVNKELTIYWKESKDLEQAMDWGTIKL